MGKLFWIFIIFALFSVIKNIIEQNAQKRKNEYKAEKRPQNNHASNESAEEFFERISQEKTQKKLKTKRSKKEVQVANFEPEISPSTNLSNINENNNVAEVKAVATSTRQATQQRKKPNRINIQDKESLRKAIILNEIMARPKGYKY